MCRGYCGKEVVGRKRDLMFGLGRSSEAHYLRNASR